MYELGAIVKMLRLRESQLQGLLCSEHRNNIAGDRVLVVAFGSAPGVPNWAGLLSRMRKTAQDAAHECFDVFYVVDPARSWYNGKALPAQPLCFHDGPAL